MVKPICMATWRYKRPDKAGHRGLKATLKYVTFREDAHHQLPADGRERWFDGGLGGSWREVYQSSQRLAGPYVLAHHFMVSPDPDLMALVPQEKRRDLMAELTINTLSEWHQARDLPVPEMSFVLHDRETTDATAPGRQMLHAHLFCAGTIPTLEGRVSVQVKEREVVRNKGGLERPTNLNHIAEATWSALLDREIGPEWRLTRKVEPEPKTSIDLTPEIKLIRPPTRIAPPLPEIVYPDIEDLLSELSPQPAKAPTRGMDLDL